MKEKTYSTTLTAWSVPTDTSTKLVILLACTKTERRNSPSMIFFWCHAEEVDMQPSACLTFSVQKASVDTISIFLLYHPCGCLQGWDTSLHCTQSMCPHVGQTLHNQLDRSLFRLDEIGESTFWQFCLRLMMTGLNACCMGGIFLPLLFNW